MVCCHRKCGEYNEDYIGIYVGHNFYDGGRIEVITEERGKEGYFFPDWIETEGSIFNHINNKNLHK